MLVLFSVPLPPSPPQVVELSRSTHVTPAAKTLHVAVRQSDCCAQTVALARLSWDLRAATKPQMTPATAKMLMINQKAALHTSPGFPKRTLIAAAQGGRGPTIATRPGPLLEPKRLQPKWLRTLCYAIMHPGRKSCFRAGFRKPQKRPSGLPKAGRRADFEALPARIQPKSCPEARFPARKHYCAT